MRIAYFGDGPWAHRALRQLLAEGYDVALVVVRADFRDPVLLEIAREHSIESTWHENVNSPEFLERLRALQADLGVSMSFNQIIRHELLHLFPQRFINCHAGKLPFYRGRNILNWALINDEQEIGVTCHYIDAGIDTGDIILQKTFPITDADDYGTVLERAIALCPAVLVEAVGLLRDASARPYAQPAIGTYFVARQNGDEFIDWSWPSRRVFTFVRAITTPGPLARTWLRVGAELALVLIERVAEVPDMPAYYCAEGAVVGISAAGNPLIKTGDTVVEVLAYQIQHPKRRRLRVSDRLGLNPNLLVAPAPAA